LAFYSNQAVVTGHTNFEIQAPLRQTFNRWTMAANYRDNKIEDLSTIYFRRNLLLLILMFSLLVVGILMILRMTAKEMELAAAKAAFVSNVSHELKTPLSLIRLFVELLETNRINPEKWQEYLKVISKETRRLTELINNILDFAAIEAGRKKYQFAPINLTEVVADVVQNYSLVLNESGFTVKTHFSKQLPLIKADRAAIEQAVLNLLNNAVKYSPQEKYIEISVNQADAETVKVDIADRGIGISFSEQKKIFEKFYRSGGTNDVHNVKGSGLGLSLVKHIIEAHQGGVFVKSEKGKGSTFTLWLPINGVTD
jgi:signal transduction histidine kinase